MSILFPAKKAKTQTNQKNKNNLTKISNLLTQKILSHLKKRHKLAKGQQISKSKGKINFKIKNKKTDKNNISNK